MTARVAAILDATEALKAHPSKYGLGKGRSAMLVSESGLYKLVMRSDIRVVTLEGNPWFVAKDVCEYLGLKPDTSGSYFKRLAQLDPKERRTLTRADTLSTGVCPIFPAGGGAVRVASISESGLYGLVSASRKPEAQEFKRWVRQTVLPSIRKDGGYVLGEEKVAAGELSEDEFIFKAMSMLQLKAERLTKERDEALAGKVFAEKQRDKNRAAADALASFEKTPQIH